MLSNIRGITTRAVDQQEHAAISTAHAADQQKHAAQQPVIWCSHVSLATIDFHTLYPRHVPLITPRPMFHSASSQQNSTMRSW